MVTSGTLTDAAPVAAPPVVEVRPRPPRSRSRRLLGNTPAMLVALLTLLNAADLISTRLVLERGGVEGNPLMRPFVEGMWGAALLKFACLAVIAALVRCCPRSPQVLRGLTAVVAWYSVVVGWNVLTLVRAA